MEELELIKTLTQLQESNKLSKDEFYKKFDIRTKDIVDFVLGYDSDYKQFSIGIVLDNSYDGYSIYYKDKKDFDFLNSDKTKSFECLNQNPMAIANYLLIESKFSLNQIELNKLVYLTYGYFLAIHNKKIFNENFESSIYGPILPSIYNTYKSYNLNNIDNFVNEFGYNESTKQFEKYFETFKNLDVETTSSIELVVSQVYDNYKQYTMLELIDITNKENSPNRIAFKNNEKILDNNLIFEYYDSMYDAIITQDEINELDKNLER